MTINDGYVYAQSTGNDGLDANGNLYINGGVVCAICTGQNGPEVAIDANTEKGYKLYLSGGVILTCGSLESGSSLTQSCWQTSTWSKNTWYSMQVGDKVYAFHTPTSGGRTMVVSASSQPTLLRGVTVEGGTERCNSSIVEDAQTSGGYTVTLNTYSGNSGW
jgi:hypothetical protein